MIFVNFKSTYKGTGESAQTLAKIMQNAQKETGVEIIAAVHDLDASRVREIYKGDVWLQHADIPSEYGGTGKTCCETISELGYHIDGVFLNHSEHRYAQFEQIVNTVNDAKKFGIKTLVFAALEFEVERACQMNPNYVAYEPPELVGSTTTSVADAHPESIKKAAEICKKYNTPLIVGAGVHSKKDVVTSLELGAAGIAVSTDIVKAENPAKELKELIGGFNS